VPDYVGACGPDIINPFEGAPVPLATRDGCASRRRAPRDAAKPASTAPPSKRPKGQRGRIPPKAGGRRASRHNQPIRDLRIAIGVAWVAFWVYWLASAASAKHGTHRGLAGRVPRLLIIAAAVVLLRFSGLHGSGTIDSVPLAALGSALFAAGLGLAIWARIHLGRNWGMPMTRKDEPELVTSGPYRFVRHPIYSGILLALLGTALATDLYLLIVCAVMGAYFIHSARVEERLMADAFPDAYASYRARSKMLIPFVL
jgi:protein-S-isoprenylcysteine O-methyltransferase Ste14